MAKAIDTQGSAGSRRTVFLTIPALVVSVLPALTCPLCWPAYAALLSSLGLGFLATSTYLLPLTAVLLAVAIGALALQIRKSGYLPFALGVASGGAILAGKFMIDSNLTTFAGIALLLIASASPLRSRRSAGSDACSTCAGTAEGARQRG
jgi:hypothetical protein